MKLPGYEPIKSSFLGVEKDLNLIINKILSSNRLMKLLYYTEPDALSKPDLTQEQKISLFGKNIKTVPKITIDKEVLNYITIDFDNFLDSTNPEYRDNSIIFDIICHFDQWQLNDTTALRPYKIAAELDALFSDAKLTGIGTTQFLGAQRLILNDEFSGLSLLYIVTHGNEDKKRALNPKEERSIQNG